MVGAKASSSGANSSVRLSRSLRARARLAPAIICKAWIVGSEPNPSGRTHCVGPIADCCLLVPCLICAGLRYSSVVGHVRLVPSPSIDEDRLRVRYFVSLCRRTTKLYEHSKIATTFLQQGPTMATEHARQAQRIARIHKAPWWCAMSRSSPVLALSGIVQRIS